MASTLLASDCLHPLVVTVTLVVLVVRTGCLGGLGGPRDFGGLGGPNGLV